MRDMHRACWKTIPAAREANCRKAKESGRKRTPRYGEHEATKALRQLALSLRVAGVLGREIVAPPRRTPVCLVVAPRLSPKPLATRSGLFSRSALGRLASLTLPKGSAGRTPLCNVVCAIFARTASSRKQVGSIFSCCKNCNSCGKLRNAMCKKCILQIRTSPCGEVKITPQALLEPS